MNRQEMLAIAKPILFNTEMVNALIDGRKTVTRRTINESVIDRFVLDKSGNLLGSFYEEAGDGYPTVDDCRYQVGDILYVREMWAKHYCSDFDIEGVDCLGCRHEQVHRVPFNENDSIMGSGCFVYKTDTGDDKIKWHPSIHMPKEAARIFLRVTDVSVGRLKDISVQQIYAEGIADIGPIDSEKYQSNTIYKLLADNLPIAKFADIWNATIKKKDLDRYGWDANPWVWVIEFERIEEDGHRN